MQNIPNQMLKGIASHHFSQVMDWWQGLWTSEREEVIHLYDKRMVHIGYVLMHSDNGWYWESFECLPWIAFEKEYDQVEQAETLASEIARHNTEVEPPLTWSYWDSIFPWRVYNLQKYHDYYTFGPCRHFAGKLAYNSLTQRLVNRYYVGGW